MTTTHERDDVLDINATKPSAAVVVVTPEMAERFLGKNVRNRSIRPTVVNAYARDMKAGRWQVTGEAIKFDSTGNLSDGQHRCHAIIKAGVPVMMFVIRGVSPEAQDVMDSGIKRQAYDALRLDGVKNPTIVAAAARLSLRLVGNRSATNAEIGEWVDRNPESVTAAEVAGHYRESIEVHPSVLAVAWLNLSAIDAQAASEFFSTVGQNRTNGDGDPRNALIRRLVTARRNNERLSQEAQLSLVYRAWNAWRKGLPLSRMPIESRNGAIRVPEPK